jgi:transaldolase
MNPLKVKIFADGANIDNMLKRAREGLVQGFTTNPTLMAKSGIKDYKAFAKQVLAEIKTVPISFEVFSDDFNEMERQAMEIASWGSNVNVKIPITNNVGQSSIPLIRRLFDKRLKLNITAILSQRQLDELRKNLAPHDDAIVSIFAGRIADTGVDPVPMMKKAVDDFKDWLGSKILWASPREVLNAYQADDCGCHIITMTDDLIAKLKLRGRPLDDVSLDTVKMFSNDAVQAGFVL